MSVSAAGSGAGPADGSGAGAGIVELENKAVVVARVIAAGSV